MYHVIYILFGTAIVANLYIIHDKTQADKAIVKNT